MRTNVVLDDDLIQEAFEYSEAKSKTALLKEALRTFIELKSKERRLATYESDLEKVREKLANVGFSESALDIIRSDRDSR